jgi:hypothetical protein
MAYRHQATARRRHAAVNRFTRAAQRPLPVLAGATVGAAMGGVLAGVWVRSQRRRQPPPSRAAAALLTIKARVRR